MGDGTTRVTKVDLRTGDRPPDVAGGVLVLDRAESLVAHTSTYEALVRAKRVSGVICLVVGEDPPVSTGSAVLSLPHVLGHATVLWVGDVHGVEWARGAQRVVPVEPDRPESLGWLVEALLVPEVFDRVRAASGDVHGAIASPGVRVVRGGVSAGELAEARSAAVDLLTAPYSRRPPGDDALTTVALAGGAADVVPAPILECSRLGVAAEGSSRALDHVDKLARALGTWSAVIGRRRPTQDLGTDVMLAGRAAENYRLGLVRLLDRMDGHLLVKDPPPDKVVELGVPAPLEARHAEATAGLHDLVAQRLQGGASLPGLAAELREAANQAGPQGCTAVLERMRATPPLSLPMPPFRRFPLSLWTIVLAFLTCAAVAFALGPGTVGRIGALVVALGWAGASWLLLARRPDEQTEHGFRAAAGATALHGLPGLLGAGSGIVLALVVPAPLRPNPLTLQVVVVVSVLVLVVTPILCWRSAARRWSRALTATELRSTVAQLSSAADEVIRREWQLVERRRAVQLSLEVAAAGLEEIGKALRRDGDRLFVPERPVPGATEPVGLARAVPPELLDVVRADLADIAFRSLAQVWIAAGSGRRPPGGIHEQALDRLLVDYARHVRDEGLITPRGGTSLDSGPRDRLVLRIWSESPTAQAALAAGADDVMIQLCTDEQLDFLSSGTAPVTVRFAPQQVRRVLELQGGRSALLADSGLVWSAGHELIGAVRLLPMRLDAVEWAHTGGQP
ncbi:hypothetical protein [Pseudonocardia lacus]|uniref:hypothetical protein n=1 Tax=Pseudonocardia lacus TaxID=2835865 RepID=UPI001BDD3923|nr:hypothetical protein [Pseudonocardia lacus]